MIRPIRSFYLLVFAAFLSGCATLDLKRPVAEEDLLKTRRVGVVSILGDDFYGISIGTTAFNNSSFNATVPDWAIDKFAVTTALSALRSNSRFEASEIDRANLTGDQLSADKSKLLWEAADRQHFDRVVVVRPEVSSNVQFMRPGFGLFERSMFGYSKRCVYAGFVVQVYDVATRQSVGWEWGGPVPCKAGSDDDLAFKSKFALYSEAEKQILRQRLEARIADSLKFSLAKLSLTQAPVAK